MFAATLYDIVFLQWPRWEEQWKAREEERLMNSGMSGSEEDLPTLSSRPNHDEPLILNQSIKGPFPYPKGSETHCDKISYSYITVVMKSMAV